MYQASFIFRPGQLDEDFHKANEVIGEAASAIEGYLGEESWSSQATGLRMATYYWRSREALNEFARLASHRAAKQQQSRWYQGYHVIVSKIETTYGDGKLEHVTGDTRRKGGHHAA